MPQIVKMLDVWAANQSDNTQRATKEAPRQTNRPPSGRLNSPEPPNAWHRLHYQKPPATFHEYLQNFTDDDDLPWTTQPAGLHRRRIGNVNTNATQPPPLVAALKHYDHLAQLSCDSGEMILRLNFSEPFKGIVYPDHNRLSPCRFFGDGHHNYELRLPLRGCGTRQVSKTLGWPTTSATDG